jgi:DNA-directed RNA polymerase specialized sigma24 family protein
MRRRLLAYFARKRVRAPEDLADDTLNRVARRLEEEPAVSNTPPAHYCFIVAKFVFLEHLRKPESLPHREVDAERAAARHSDDVDTGERERMLACLDRCLGGLHRDERTLVLDYYRGEEHQKIAARRQLAERLGLSANALAIRACRIRDKLERCVAPCAAGKTK